MGRAVGPSFDTKSVWFHVVDGVFRVGILVGYIWVHLEDEGRRAAVRVPRRRAPRRSGPTRRTGRCRRQEASPFTTRHPRCGTSFLFIVVGVAVLLHVALLPFVPRLHPNDVVNQVLMVLIKVPMAFPIAGLAYELQRWSASDSCPAFIKGLTRPGIWLQGITTTAVRRRQLEIALLSLDRALAREEGGRKAAEGRDALRDLRRRPRAGSRVGELATDPILT